MLAELMVYLIYIVFWKNIHSVKKKKKKKYINKESTLPAGLYANSCPSAVMKTNASDACDCQILHFVQSATSQ
jgi:hypothetical protein